MELNPDDMTEHDKAMLAVAEKGDPNDPSEVKDAEPSTAPELPEGIESVEDLIAAYKDLSTKEPEENAESTEEKTDETEEKESEPEEKSEEPEGLSEAEIELRELKAFEMVGGKENYAAMTDFAKANLDEEQIAVFDNAVNGASRSVALLAVQGLSAMHQLHQMQTFGQEGEMTNPSTGGLNVAQGYATRSDMMADMADPRYQTDETFVNQVMQKMALSNF